MSHAKIMHQRTNLSLERPFQIIYANNNNVTKCSNTQNFLFPDDVLNKAIKAMRNQREEDLRSKDGLAQEKARLEALINQLQGRVADLEGQVSKYQK